MSLTFLLFRLHPTTHCWMTACLLYLLHSLHSKLLRKGLFMCISSSDHATLPCPYFCRISSSASHFFTGNKSIIASALLWNATIILLGYLSQCTVRRQNSWQFWFCQGNMYIEQIFELNAYPYFLYSPKSDGDVVSSSPVHNGGFFPEFFPDFSMSLQPSPIPKAPITSSCAEPAQTCSTTFKAPSTNIFASVTTTRKGNALASTRDAKRRMEGYQLLMNGSHLEGTWHGV